MKTKTCILCHRTLSEDNFAIKVSSRNLNKIRYCRRAHCLDCGGGAYNRFLENRKKQSEIKKQNRLALISAFAYDRANGILPRGLSDEAR